MQNAIARIKDPAFKARFVHEFEAVSSWSDKLKSRDISILDFGCDQGIAALGFALRRPDASVHGIDIGAYQGPLASKARENLGLELPSNLHFHVSDGTGLPFADESLDLIYSWSVFEHIRMDLFPAILAELRRVMKNDAHLLVQIDPLYYSPRGAHLYGIIDEPWIHLLDQHDVLVDRIMAKGKHVSAIQQYETLNRITEPELVEKLTASGFRLLRRHRTDCGVMPPERLQRIYQSDVLTTSACYMLACKDSTGERDV